MAERDHRFAEAMNDLRSVNLLAVENAMAQSFVEEYFAQPSQESLDNDSDGSWASDVESHNTGSDPEETDDEDPEDQPLIVVETYREGDGLTPNQDDLNPGPAGGADPQNQQDKVAVYRCQCKCLCFSIFTAEKDMFILGQIRCFARSSSYTAISKRKDQKERKFQRSTYLYHGQSICRDTFLFLHK